MALAPVVICGMVWCLWGPSPGHGAAPVSSAATGSDGFCCHYPGNCKDWMSTYVYIWQDTHTKTNDFLLLRKECTRNPQAIPKKCSRAQHV